MTARFMGPPEIGFNIPIGILFRLLEAERTEYGKYCQDEKIKKAPRLFIKVPLLRNFLILRVKSSAQSCKFPQPYRFF